MEAEQRLRLTLAKQAHEAAYREGHATFGREDIAAAGEGIPDHLVDHVMRQLADEGLVDSSDGFFIQVDIGLVMEYEQSDGPLCYERNAVRREILRRLARAYEEKQRGLHYLAENAESFAGADYAMAVSDCQALERMGFAEVQLFIGQSFDAEITAEGYSAVRDEERLRASLPTSGAEDEEAGLIVARDILSRLVFDLAQLLADRGWEAAVRELGRGDDQYDEGHWVDAVREYYSALESSLKLRLDEAGVPYGDGASLKDLAREASKSGLIPRNYQSLFEYTDSIRSPRSHGAGAAPEEVEVGEAEALLMGNHVRGLILYLAHRAE